MNYVVEYGKFLKSPIYAIENNFQTFDATQGGYVDYKLFPLQKKLIRAYEKNRHNIVAKPRQAGVSTTTAAYLAVKIALATKESPQQIEILANKLDQSCEFLDKVRKFTEQMPAWVWGDEYNWNKEKDGHIIGKGAAKRVEFVNGSYIAAKPCTRDSLRGTTPTFLVIDEAAFVTEGAETYAAAAAAVATGGKMILISTPNGMDELYYKAYIGAVNKENNFNIVRMHWAYDPRYNYDLVWQKITPLGDVIEEFPEDKFTEESIGKRLEEGYEATSTWYRDMCVTLNNNQRAIAQELKVKFQGSGGNVISFNTIEHYEQEMIKEPIKKQGLLSNIWIWNDPIEGHRYIAGVDVSTGDDNDYSVLSIIDLDEYEVVLEYREKVNSEQMSEVVEKYCNRYNAMAVIDTTGGYADLLIHLLKKRDFKHFYYDTFNEDVKDSKDSENKNEKIGFKIQKYRHAAISNFVGLVESKKLKTYSIRQINEWKTFIWINGRADHQRSFNDDCIMSLVMPLWVAEGVYSKIEKAEKMQRAVIEAFKSIKRSTRQDRMVTKTKEDRLKDIYGDNAWLFY
jgi:hypothetical protein